METQSLESSVGACFIEKEWDLGREKFCNLLLASPFSHSPTGTQNNLWDREKTLRVASEAFEKYNLKQLSHT